jgi:hypothetical protein
MVLVCASAFLSGVWPAAPAAAVPETTSVRLSPQDTFLNLNATNYSTGARLTTYTWPDNQVANAIVMKFDVSALPPGATIEEARLNVALVQSDLSLDFTYTVTAHKLLGRDAVISAATGYTAAAGNPWTANACCFNNIPMAQANLSPAYATRAIDKIPGFKVWDVTTMVQEWMQTPAENFGLLLNADTTRPRDRYRQFASMEHVMSSLRPFLEVTYSAGDATPPSVAITAPQNGASVSGTSTLQATASDNLAVAAVQFHVDGAPVGPEQLSPPYRFGWDTTTVSDGARTITASARDASGNTAKAAVVTITVENGVAILTPQDTFINLDAVNYSTGPALGTYTWPDDKPANAIVMKFNLAAIPAEALVQEATLHLHLVDSDSTADPTYVVPAHKIIVKNPIITAATGVTADGTHPWTPTACCHNGVPLAQADISAAYDTAAIDKTLGFKSWTITGLVQEWLLDPATNFGLLLNADLSKGADRYRFFASMEDPNTQRRPFLRVAYVVSEDSTPPVVAVTAPPDSTVVSGHVTIRASASDDAGITGVLFNVDGQPIGPEDTTAPYEIAWDAAAATEGNHAITATARDFAGNVATSQGVVVTHDRTGPSVSITTPASGSTVAGSVTVSASAADSVGVAGVQFQLDGASLGAEDTVAPYSVSWNTTTAPDGSRTITAVARDTGGNRTTSAALSVTVSNAPPPPPPATLWPHEPADFTVIEETGWESGTLGAWYRIFQSSDKPIGVGAIGHSAISERRALQIDYAAGHVGGGGTELRYDIASQNRRNEIYVGYYVQVSPQWEGHSSAINKMIYLHDGGSSFSAMWYEIFGSGSGPLGLYVVNQSGSGPAGIRENFNPVTFTRSQWHRVEIYQKQGASQNGIVRVWVDGVLAIDRSDVGIRSTPVDNITISGIWGGVGDSKPHADFMRFDRIRISRPGQ